MKNKVSKRRLAKLVPDRLREARLARGFTMKELAEKVGVTRQSISQYELGQSSPSGEVLSKLVRELDFPLGYFSNPPDKEIPSSVTFFRSLSSATKKSREMIKQRERWVEKIYLYLQEYLYFPEVNIPQFEYFSSRNEEEKAEEIETIAKNVRKNWGLGLGPISDVLLLLEKEGIIITRFKFNVLKTDACSQWRGNRPFIYLSDDKGSACRSRFDAAHELAHLLFHSWIEGEEQLSKINKVIEKEADRFAGAFLLPRESFSREVMSTSIEHFKELKKRWKVSIRAMIYRCEDLGILSKNQTLYLWKQVSRYRKKEPLDDELTPEFPRILKQGVEMLINKKPETIGELLEFTKLYPHQVEEVCNLEQGTLDKKGKVVHIEFKKKS